MCVGVSPSVQVSLCVRTGLCRCLYVCAAGVYMCLYVCAAGVHMCLHVCAAGVCRCVRVAVVGRHQSGEHTQSLRSRSSV